MDERDRSGRSIAIRYLAAALGLVVAAGLVSWLAPAPSRAVTPPLASVEPDDVAATSLAPTTAATTTTAPAPPVTAPATIAPPPPGSVEASLDVDGLELFGEHPFEQVVYRLDVAVGAPPASVTISWDDRLGSQLTAVGGAGCTSNPCTVAVTGAGTRVVAAVTPAGDLDPRSVVATVALVDGSAPPVTVRAAELPDRMAPAVDEPARWPRLVAWCGVEPTDPLLAQKVQALVAAGVQAMHGPCRQPDWATYLATQPGKRYMAPDEYARLVDAVAPYGMRVIVYDERVWSDDPEARRAAIEQWRPSAQAGTLLAFDASDEINRDQWPVLVERHDLYTRLVQPELGVPLFGSHLPWMDQLAARDVPAMVPLSVNTFRDDDTAAMVARHPDRPLHCTLNLAAFGPYAATSETLETTVGAAFSTSCRSWLIFNPTSEANPRLFANETSTWTTAGESTDLLDTVGRLFAGSSAG